jgi:hypothetical protein
MGPRTRDELEGEVRASQVTEAESAFEQEERESRRPERRACSRFVGRRSTSYIITISWKLETSLSIPYSTVYVALDRALYHVVVVLHRKEWMYTIMIFRDNGTAHIA